MIGRGFLIGVLLLHIALPVSIPMPLQYSTVTERTSSQTIALVRPSVVYILSFLRADVNVPGMEEEFGLPSSLSVITGATGTGFVINPNGYIVTNGHVVWDWENEFNIVYYVLLQYVNDLAQLVEQAYGGTLSQEEMGLILNYALQEYLAGNARVANIQKSFFVQFGAACCAFETPEEAIPANLVASIPAEEKDLAIIKIDRTNVPTVLLGDSDKVLAGDGIFILGYPGVVTEHPYLSEETDLVPTVTSGIISAVRVTEDGSTALQTDAGISWGNSGGPAISEEGEVIGVATFGTIGVSGELLTEWNFLRPSNLVKELAQANGIDNVQGPTDVAFREAMDLFWAKRYSAAISKFEEVLSLYPEHPDAQNYIDKSQEGIARGEGVITLVDILGPVGMTVVLVAVPVIVGVVILTLYFLRRRRPVETIPPSMEFHQ